MATFIVNDTDPRSKYNLLLKLIPVGEENGIAMRKLAAVLNVTDRELRRLVERARIAGNIIAAGDSGYYIPADEQELRSYFNRSMSRIKVNSRALNAVRRKLKEVAHE